MAVVVLDTIDLEPKRMLAEKHQEIVSQFDTRHQEMILDSQESFGLIGLYLQQTFDNLGLCLAQAWRLGTVDSDLNYGEVDLEAVVFDTASQAQSHLQANKTVLLAASVEADRAAFDKTDDWPLDSGSLNFAKAFDMTDLYLIPKESDTVDQDLLTASGKAVLVFDWLAENQVPARQILIVYSAFVTKFTSICLMNKNERPQGALQKLIQIRSPSIRQLILLVKSCQAMIQVVFFSFLNSSCNLNLQLFMAIMTTWKLTYEREFDNSGQKENLQNTKVKYCSMRL